jgi:two-component system cell cycle sensor histidine kinase/response regulator CckA
MPRLEDEPLVPVEVSADTKTILIVEDEGLIAASLERRLQLVGYTVSAIADNADDAIRFATSTTPDLVLMDIHLKGDRDGIEAANVLRNLDIPVVFLTAHTDAETLRRACLAEPYGYIVKPLGASNIRVIVEVAIHKHKSVSTLRKRQKWFSSALRNVGDALIASDSNGKVEYMNAEAERLTGWKFSEARGLPTIDVFPIEPQPAPPAAASPFSGPPAASVVRVEHELIPRHASSPALVESVISANETESGFPGQLISFRDLTARKFPEQLPVIHEPLALRALAHDFHNLLSIILGYADVLQSDARRTSKEIDEIVEAAKLAAELSRQFSALSHAELPLRQIVDLNEVVRTGDPMIRRALNRFGCELEFALSPEPLFVACDPVSLKRAIVTLAANAREASSAGGRLRISTCMNSSNQVSLVIEDTLPSSGSGAVEKLFGLPASETRTFGIAIVHGIVAQSGGTVEFQTDESAARFLVSLPLASPPGPGILIPCLDASPVRQSKGTVLLVDMERDLRSQVKDDLRHAGFEVMAGLAEQALALLDSENDSIDLVITGLILPSMTGPSLAKRFLDRSQHTRILFVSEYGDHTLLGPELTHSGRVEFIRGVPSSSALVQRAHDMFGKPGNSIGI